eukprot:12521853-Prorocentrum_lima.AAC.1
MSRTVLEALTRSARKACIGAGPQRVRTIVAAFGVKAPMLQPSRGTKGNSKCPARLSWSTCPASLLMP